MQITLIEKHTSVRDREIYSPVQPHARSPLSPSDVVSPSPKVLQPEAATLITLLLRDRLPSPGQKRSRSKEHYVSPINLHNPFGDLNHHPIGGAPTKPRFNHPPSMPPDALCPPRAFCSLPQGLPPQLTIRRATNPKTTIAISSAKSPASKSPAP